jgi:integrase
MKEGNTNVGAGNVKEACMALTQGEARRLLGSISDKRDWLLIQLGLVTGCRVSEIVAIRTGDILPDGIAIHAGRRGASRECVLDTETRAQLDHYLAEKWSPKTHRRHMLFDLSRMTANRILKRWCAAAGIPVQKRHWHVLRRTYVVLSLEEGVPVCHINEQIGHSRTPTAKKYYDRPGIDSRRVMVKEQGR